MSPEHPAGAIDLPGGHWALLRDPADVTERQRRPLQRALRRVSPATMARGQELAAMPDEVDAQPNQEKFKALARLQWEMSDEEADAYQEANDAAIAALVDSWSFDQPITVEGVLDLPGRALDRLRVAVAPLVNDLAPDFSDPDPNRPAPTGGSNGSATPSAVGLQMTSPTTGERIASSASESA